MYLLNVSRVSLLLLAVSFIPYGMAQGVSVPGSDSMPALEIVEVPISALHPTQAYIAHDQVNYTLQRYAVDQQKLFDDLCENRGQGDDAILTAASNPRDANSYQCGDAPGSHPDDMKTAVRGPEGQLYLTDGHHTFSIFQDFDALGAQLEVAVVVTHDRSDLSEPEFWQWLQDSNLTWLYDATGQAINWMDIPSGFGRNTLADDPWRAAMYFLRDLIWQRPQPAMPFAEFYWAQHLRNQPELTMPVLDSPSAYLQWLTMITRHIQSLPADTSTGPGGEGPDAMGRLDLTEAQGLWVLLCDNDKPGRLALALMARGVAAGCDNPL